MSLSGEIDTLERELLAIKGVGIQLDRDSLGYLKLRVSWDAFTVLEAGVANDGDWRDLLRHALDYINARRGAPSVTTR